MTYLSMGANRISTREVEPSMVHTSLGWWYLSAYCRLAGGRRTFRVDRIRSLTVLDETFTPHPGPDPPTAEFTPSADSIYAVLALDDGARWVAEYYPVDIISDEAGELVVRFAMSDPRVAARLLVRLGGASPSGGRRGGSRRNGSAPPGHTGQVRGDLTARNGPECGAGRDRNERALRAAVP